MGAISQTHIAVNARRLAPRSLKDFTISTSACQRFTLALLPLRIRIISVLTHYDLHGWAAFKLLRSVPYECLLHSVSRLPIKRYRIHSRFTAANGGACAIAGS